MSQQGRWPKNGETASELEHKIEECMWWSIILDERMNIDSSEAWGRRENSSLFTTSILKTAVAGKLILKLLIEMKEMKIDLKYQFYDTVRSICFLG